MAFLATFCDARESGVTKLVVSPAETVDESTRARLRSRLPACGAFAKSVFGSALPVVCAETGALDLIDFVGWGIAWKRLSEVVGWWWIDGIYAVRPFEKVALPIKISISFGGYLVRRKSFDLLAKKLSDSGGK